MTPCAASSAADGSSAEVASGSAAAFTCASETDSFCLGAAGSGAGAAFPASARRGLAPDETDVRGADGGWALRATIGASERKLLHQPQLNAATETHSRSIKASAHDGKRGFGKAAGIRLISGTAARWRSSSDFLRASRMKDTLLIPQQQWSSGRPKVGAQRDLRLRSDDAVHRQQVLPLIFAYAHFQRGVVQRGAGVRRRFALDLR
jgi:hypothetical protein